MMRCAICKNTSGKRIIVSEHRLNLGGEFAYWVCDRCKLVALIDKPGDMGKYYENYAYHTKGVVRKPSAIQRGYNTLTGLLLRPLHPYIPRDNRKSVLDIGCARGQYLAKLKARGFTNLAGIELSREAVRNSVDKSLRITCSSLEQYKPRKRFDFITLNQVFEHFEDPHRSIERLKTLAKPGCRIIMSFPNYASLARSLFGRYWPGYDAPRHYFTFSPKNIRMLAAQHSLEVERIRYISRPSQFLGSFQYLHNTITGSKHGLNGFYRNSKVLDLLFFPPAYLLNLIKAGDMIEVHLRAPERRSRSPR